MIYITAAVMSTMILYYVVRMIIGFIYFFSNGFEQSRIFIGCHSYKQKKEQKKKNHVIQKDVSSKNNLLIAKNNLITEKVTTNGY